MARLWTPADPQVLSLHSDPPLGETIELSVVIPCLDEAETIATVIGKARESLRALDVVGEVIVADNGSTDGSTEIAEAAGARVVRVPVRGYGAALRAGIRAAHGRYVIMADADDSYDLTALEPFLARLRAGDELVMGNRFQGGISDGAMPALHRYLGNPALSFLGRLFYRSRIRDFHCGMRGFRRESIQRLDLRTTGMEFASEMIVKATLHDLKISEVPTTLRPDGRSRPPHLRSWRDGWRHLTFLLLCSPRWLFLYPGLILMLAGTGVMIWLLPATRYLGHVGLDIQTLLYAGIMIGIGYQAVLFAVLGKVFAITEGLLPADARMTWLLARVRLETGLLVGAGLVLAGLVGAVVGFTNWDALSFGPLDPSKSLRLAIPSATALTLGVETILASFFLSLLGVRRGSAD
ncbi:MAG TPA: glycosyltransferase family 2 protein [Mycobacteriales bacterium]|nr:glycosyltransferase family 2 protein [Mycobacteriales bacterium]